MPAIRGPARAPLGSSPATGFPLEIDIFERNKAKTKTLLPALDGFAKRHGVSTLIVMAEKIGDPAYEDWCEEFWRLTSAALLSQR